MTCDMLVVSSRRTIDPLNQGHEHQHSATPATTVKCYSSALPASPMIFAIFSLIASKWTRLEFCRQTRESELKNNNNQIHLASCDCSVVPLTFLCLSTTAVAAAPSSPVVVVVMILVVLLTFCFVFVFVYLFSRRDP